MGKIIKVSGIIRRDDVVKSFQEVQIDLTLVGLRVKFFKDRGEPEIGRIHLNVRDPGSRRGLLSLAGYVLGKISLLME